MKKVTSIILSCILVFTLAMPAFAVEPFEENIPPATEITTAAEPGVVNDSVIEENAVVARVYLCATINSLTGHIWLYFINLTDTELPLGYVTLKPHEEMSVGSLRNSRKDGGGTYYNGEAFMANDLTSVCKHTTSIYTDITYSQLITIGNKIKSRNSYLLLGNNCGDFACSCWNSIAPAGKKVVNILVPLFTIISVVFAGGKRGQIQMKSADITRVFKQTANGVKQADKASFNESCVNW